MDLKSAMKAVVERSKKDPKKLFYLNVDAEGEFEISNTFKQPASTACYRNGSEIALPTAPLTTEEKEQTKKQTKKAGEPVNSNNMKNEKNKPAKKAAAKKGAKKGAAKKSTKDSSTWGKQVDISIKDMRAGIRKGFQYRDPQGVIQTEKYMATRAKQDHVRTGMWVAKVSK